MTAIHKTSVFCLPFNIICFFVLLVSTTSVFGVFYGRAVATPDEQAELEQYGRLHFDERMEALRGLSAKKKKRWADLFRWFDPDLEWRDTKKDASGWKPMLALGDKITADYLVSQYRKLPDEDLIGVLTSWCAPEAVPFFVEIIEANAPAPPPSDSDLPQNGVTKTANECFYVNVGNAYYLSKDVREWAKSRTDEVIHWNEQKFRDLDTALREKRISYEENLRGRDAAGAPRGVRFREMPLEWWRDNKTAFLAGRYDEVKPGRTMDGSPYVPLRLRSGNSVPQHTPANEIQSQRAVSAAVSSEPEHRPSHHYLFFAAMTGILAAVIVLFRVRFNRSKQDAQ